MASGMSNDLCRGKAFRRRLGGSDSDALVGCFVIELQTCATVRIMAEAGFDFVVLDMEHSGCSIADLQPLIAEARVAMMPTVVRVPDDCSSAISRVLDTGADAVMVPHVTSPATARAIVTAARFAPLGTRGFSPLTRFDGVDDPQARMNDAISVIVQIEGIDAVENVNGISGVSGVDAVFVGPYDLAESLRTSDVAGATVLEVAGVVARNTAEGVGLGIYMGDPENSYSWWAKGFEFQCISFDGQMLLRTAREIRSSVSGEM